MVSGLEIQFEKTGYLPEATTDFVFSIVIEELGLIGAGLILALLFFLILRIMIVGVKARNPFNSMMALGVGALMLMQVFVNIGGNLRANPIDRGYLPLPFTRW